MGGRAARALLGAWALFTPPALLGQEPPDTVVRPDTAAADTVSADTIFYNLPPLGGEVPAGWERGVWEWTDEDIGTSGANTLVELLDDVPGLVPIRGGDYGTPLGLTAFGAAGGALRVLVDGFEMVPLEGSVPDLARVGLVGIERVRLERRTGGLVIHLFSRRYDDGRPFSLVEAGTGELDTNQLRFTFTEPTALGGSLAVGLDRVETRGSFPQEEGNRTGAWLRYQLHRGDDAGLGFELRRMGSETEVEDFAGEATRTDWTVRGRARLGGGFTGEAYYGTSNHEVDDPRERFLTEGGSRSQTGLRLGWTGQAGLFADAALRRFGGDDLPGDRFELSGGASRPGLGGVSAGWERVGWIGESTSRGRIEAWTEPWHGLSFFGSYESGDRGARTDPIRDVRPPPDTGAAEPPPEMEPDTGAVGPARADGAAADRFRVVDHSGGRLGAAFRWRGVTLSGALLRVEQDSLLPTGLEFDRDQPAFPGGERTGWEVYARAPVPILDGLHFEGSLQRWNEEWRYLPEQIYRASLVYHQVFLESGNLELWARLGVRGRDPMQVHVLEDAVDEETGEPIVDEDTGEVLRVPATVPFYQNWNGSVQVRILSMRIFIGWDNFTRRLNLQDVPDRVLPLTRAFYGIRWTLWN